MDNFIFSLNATLPSFILILLGWGARRINLIDDGFAKGANRLGFSFALPVMLFRDLYVMDIREVFDLRVFLFCVIATLVAILVIWGLARTLIKDKGAVGSFVQCSFRSTAAILGLSIIQNIYGNTGYGPVMVLAIVPLYNVFSVIILQLENPGAKSNGRNPILNAVLGIAKNPLIIAILLVLPFMLLGIRLPVLAERSVNNIAQMGMPLALISIGAGFNPKGVYKKRGLVALASAVKLVLLPAAALGTAMAFGFTGPKLVALMVAFAGPTTVSAYIMAENMGGDGELASGIVVMTTLLSSVTLTAWVFSLRTLGLL